MYMYLAVKCQRLKRLKIQIKVTANINNHDICIPIHMNYRLYNTIQLDKPNISGNIYDTYVHVLLANDLLKTLVISKSEIYSWTKS